MTPRSLVILVIVAAAAAGCGKPNDGKPAKGSGATETAAYDPKKDPLVNPASLTVPYDPKSAADDEWLYSTLSGSPQTLNPMFGSSNFEFRFISLLWASPFTFDASLKWSLDKDVAESLDESADHKTFTLHLKPGRTWQDGHPWTARDIEFSYQQFIDENVPVTNRESVLRIESLKVIDDLTVQYVVKQPSPMSRWDIGFDIIPKHLYEKGKAEDPTLKASNYYAALNRNPIGSGPYKFVEWKENDKVVLERWDGYMGANGHFKRIVFRIIPDINVQLLTFEKGETDEMEMQTKQFAVESVRSESFKKVGVKGTGPQWLYSYVVYNQRGNPFFADVRVRRAMTMATDIPSLIERVMYKLPEIQCGPFHRDSWMFNPEIKPLPFDLKAAGALLDEAGWKLDPETGWRKKGDTPFSFTLLMPQGNTVTVDIAAVIQQDFKSIGVEMKTQVIEWATFQERNRKHEFQASIAAFGTGVDPDLSRNQFGTKAIDDGRNYGCYSNARVDELYDLGAHEFDFEKRKKIYQEIGKILYDEQAYTFMWSRPTLWAFNKRIQGVTFSPRGVWNFDPAVMSWWVSKQNQMYNR